MAKLVNYSYLIGTKFNRLTVVGYVRSLGRIRVSVKCDCGNEKTVLLENLRSGKTGTCGCGPAPNTKHGKSKSAEYLAWENMKARCYKASTPDKHRYAERGIGVCDRWLNSFENFFSDMGSRPGKGYSLDRIDNNGNYEPGNCRWATIKEQNNNQQRNVLITYNYVTKTLTEWAHKYGINSKTLKHRIDSGWEIEKALTMPPDMAKTQFKRR